MIFSDSLSQQKTLLFIPHAHSVALTLDSQSHSSWSLPCLQSDKDRLVYPWGAGPPALTATAQLSALRFHVPQKGSHTAAIPGVSACRTAIAWTMYSRLRFGEAHAPTGTGALTAALKNALVCETSSGVGRIPPGLLEQRCDSVWSSQHSCSQSIYKGSNDLDKSVRLTIWFANSTATQYCCGDADTTQTNSTLACIDGSSTFTLSDATPVLGVAGLANAQAVSWTNSSSDTSATTTPTAITVANQNDCSAQRQDTTTVGSVLGVSLVAVAIALIVWAVWERRQKILWWQRAIGLAPQWPPENATWLRAPRQNSKPPPCPVTRAKLAYAAHQQQKSAQEQPAEQPAPTYRTHNGEQPMRQTQISSPQRPREMPDGIPAAAEMDAT